MSTGHYGYSVTDLEDSAEEELLKKLLTEALEQTPKASRGTSTITEWMTIIETSNELKKLLALNKAQRQSLETYASKNDDLELDTNQVICLYSMILKSEIVPVSFTSSSSSSTRILKNQQQQPISPTPSDHYIQRAISSTSQRVDEVSRSIESRSQTKGKKVSIDPTLLENTEKENNDDNNKKNHSGEYIRNNTMTSDDEEEEEEQHVHHLGRSTSSLSTGDKRNGVDMVWYERSSPNHPRWNESIHISDSVKTSTTTTEDRKQNKRNGSRSSSSHGKYSPEADQERKQQEQLEYKISLLDAMTRDLQKQVLEYRQKITHHEELESLQQQQINELTAHNTKSKVKYDELNQQYRHLEHTNSNEMDRLKEALEEARNNGLHWKEALDNSEKDNLNLKETLNKSETENLNLKESLDKSEKDSLLLKDALATRTKEWTTTQSDLTNYKEDLLRIKSERDQQIEEVKKLRQKVEDFDRLIPEGMTADQIHEEIEKVDRLEKEKESYEALVNETTNQLALLSKKNKELQQRLVEEDPTTSHGLFSFWHQRKTNKLDKKLLEAMCEQLEVQATVVDRLRTEVLSGDRLINHTMEKSNHRGWYWMLIFGICLVILSSCIGYAIVTPPISYGLWNDPHGCHSWQSCYTEPRSWLFLILDRILLPTNFTYVTPL